MNSFLIFFVPLNLIFSPITQETMINYKDLGLVNTREMFKKAIHGGYAIPAFNFNNMEQMQAIIQAAVETKSPVILQVSSGARKYANQTILPKNSDARIRKLFSISIMVILSNYVKVALTWDSLPS